MAGILHVQPTATCRYPQRFRYCIEFNDMGLKALPSQSLSRFSGRRVGRGFSGGERVWKFTGGVSQMGQSGEIVIEQVFVTNKTLYASSFFVANDNGYTKHFFAGSERICSKLGGGLEMAPLEIMEATVEELHEDYEHMRHNLYEMLQRFANCNPNPEFETMTYIDLEPYLGGIEEWLNRHEPEENRFFFHPDHLGSSSFITDADGEGYQHLQYMPFRRDLCLPKDLLVEHTVPIHRQRER
jgi:hypothetical protein